jgi:hypothetical protein
MFEGTKEKYLKIMARLKLILVYLKHQQQNRQPLIT